VQAVLISFISVLTDVFNFFIPNSYEPVVVFSVMPPVTDSAAVVTIFTAIFISNAPVFLFPIYKLSRTIKTVSNL
jgi:hypothetical protein